MKDLAFQMLKRLEGESREDRYGLEKSEEHIRECFQRGFTRYYAYDDSSFLSIYSKGRIRTVTVIRKRSYNVARRTPGILWLVKDASKLTSISETEEEKE